MKSRAIYSRAKATVSYTHLTDELPSEEDIERVRARLVAKGGWPVDDEHTDGELV